SVFAYDGDNLVEETNASGTAEARYSQGLNIDEPLAMLLGGATNYYNADGLGSVTCPIKFDTCDLRRKIHHHRLATDAKELARRRSPLPSTLLGAHRIPPQNVTYVSGRLPVRVSERRA